jgi:hypothetical protein
MKKSINVAIIEIHPQSIEKATNFDIRIKKAEAVRLLREFGGRLPFDIMCKEYGDDPENWVGLTAEDLDSDTGTLPDVYQTFEIWYN